MKSLRLRLALWYFASFIAAVLLFSAITYYHLRYDLGHAKRMHQPQSDHPEEVIEKLFTRQEVDLLSKHLIKTSLLYLVSFVVVLAAIGFFLARKSIHPIARLNAQLQEMGPKNLDHRIHIAEADSEFRELQIHINELLERLDIAFKQLTEFSSKVAHELRTPLTLLRLKIEQAADEIEPELSETLQDELQRLNDYVDNSLLVARAELGQLPFRNSTFSIYSVLEEMGETYQALAKVEKRHIDLRCIGPCEITFDRHYFQQILHNILSNALKHGERTIRLSTKHHRGFVVLYCINGIRSDLKSANFGVGLGFRIIGALTALGDRSAFSHRRFRHYFITALRFPEANVTRAATGAMASR